LWEGVYDWAVARDKRIDSVTRDASRFWYQPATAHAQVGFVSWTHAGPALELDYERLVKPKPKASPLPPLSGAGARRAAQRRLDHPEARERAAQYCRAAVNRNSHAKGAICPQCGRPSIWWRVDEPGPAHCNHKRSCGWVGSLARVLDLVDQGRT
jgi:hypothetical protein